jgi:hypothetical protein
MQLYVYERKIDIVFLNLYCEEAPHSHTLLKNNYRVIYKYIQQYQGKLVSQEDKGGTKSFFTLCISKEIS